MTNVPLHPDVETHLRQLPTDVEKRIRNKLEDAGDNPGHSLKRLSGRQEYRLRIPCGCSLAALDTSDRLQIRSKKLETRSDRATPEFPDPPVLPSHGGAANGWSGSHGGSIAVAIW